jgi:hypothetical protein
MPAAFVSHYRCPPDLAAFDLSDELSTNAGFFSFRGAACYGRRSKTSPRMGRLPEVASQATVGPGMVTLPFDLSEVITNLQQERYQQNGGGLVEKISAATSTRKLYYLLRPLLALPLRKQLQKISLSGWKDIGFPRWPVDFSVETLLECVMKLVIESTGDRRVPFIWFWPDGAPSCAMMTHDVEARSGRDFCEELMNLDDEYGVKASFQIIPEDRYEVSESFLDQIRRRGFEVNVHDLNHDGRLFHDRQQFMERAVRINQYGRTFQSRGFRAGVMYRRQEWFDALDFSYDMSVPNAAHLEPQRGGCCTVMPYFVGDMLELPLTTIQDYSLFHILGNYSIGPWRTQIDQILARHGLMSFMAHPDYLLEPRARNVYAALLSNLRHLRREHRVWLALPREVDQWWRNRNRMILVRRADSWSVEGPDSERARVAYASLDGDRVVYELGTE